MFARRVGEAAKVTMRRDLVVHSGRHAIKNKILFGQAVVFFQDFAEAVVGKSDGRVVVDASHGLGGDHGVDYGFFGGLDRG